MKMCKCNLQTSEKCGIISLYVVNFEVDWNYKQFIDTLELEQHMGITEVGIPMPPKVRKRSTQNSNRKNNGAA